LLKCALGLALLYIIALLLRVHALTKERDEARAALNTAPEWSVSVEQLDPYPVPLDLSNDSVEEWLMHERDAVLKPMFDQRDKERAEETLRKSGILPGAVFRAFDTPKMLEKALGGAIERQTHSYEEFHAQVASYVTVARPEVPAYARAALVESQNAKVHLRLHNRMTSNVNGVQLELTIPPLAVVYGDAPWEDVSMPTRPRWRGPVNRLASAVASPAWITNATIALPVPKPWKPDFIAQSDGSTRVVFMPEDLRPESDADLLAVTIFIKAEDIGDSNGLPATWRLTTTSHDHAREGDTVIRFAEPARVIDVLPGAEKKDVWDDSAEPAN
jgi:hypothetical protein